MCVLVKKYFVGDLLSLVSYSADPRSLTLPFSLTKKTREQHQEESSAEPEPLSVGSVWSHQSHPPTKLGASLSSFCKMRLIIPADNYARLCWRSKIIMIVKSSRNMKNTTGRKESLLLFSPGLWTTSTRQCNVMTASFTWCPNALGQEFTIHHSWFTISSRSPTGCFVRSLRQDRPAAVEPNLTHLEEQWCLRFGHQAMVCKVQWWWWPSSSLRPVWGYRNWKLWPLVTNPARIPSGKRVISQTLRLSFPSALAQPPLHLTAPSPLKITMRKRSLLQGLGCPPSQT